MLNRRRRSPHTTKQEVPTEKDTGLNSNINSRSTAKILTIRREDHLVNSTIKEVTEININTINSTTRRRHSIKRTPAIIINKANIKRSPPMIPDQLGEEVVEIMKATSSKAIRIRVTVIILKDTMRIVATMANSRDTPKSHATKKSTKRKVTKRKSNTMANKISTDLTFKSAVITK